MARIHPKYYGLLFALFMSLSMAVPMSGVMLLVNVGTDIPLDEFLAKWAKAFAIGFVVAMPTAAIISKPVKALVDRLTSDA